MMRHHLMLAALFSLLVLPYGGLVGAAQVAPASSLEEVEARTDLMQQPIAVLRALDKITARITELEVRVGGRQRFGTLDIMVRYCRSRPPIETPESFVYVEIQDVGLKTDAPVRDVFSGWMVASSPALNPLEHPVYDVWVIDCKTDAPDASSGSR